MKNKKSLPALINGDLIVHSVPTAISNKAVGRYLIYRMFENQAIYWAIADTKPEAVTISNGISGHVIRIETIWFK